MVKVKASSPLEGCIQLSASKSISNRLLMIKAISKTHSIYNLSESDDTQILNQILSNTHYQTKLIVIMLEPHYDF